MRYLWLTAVFCSLGTASALAGNAVSLEVLGTYATGTFDEGAAEIGAFDPATDRLFVVNGDTAAIDVLDLSDPNQPTLLFSIDVTPYGDQANSVAVHDGTVAAAVEADPATDPGKAVFFDTSGQFISQVTVGALPDMLTFTPDGTKLVVANEGEPNDDVDVDPEGSISIVDLSGGIASLDDGDVSTAGFTAFNGQTLDPSIRVFVPGATVAQDLEPEYIAISANSQTAWVVLQENNALAVVNLNTATVTSLIGLGFKDHSQAGNELDPSNRDSGIDIANWPVFGMFQPDAIAAFGHNGTTYLITANEGDSRDYDGFSEEERIKDITLDPTAFPNAAALQEDENLGRLNITTTLGDTDNDNDFDELYAYGARSFSIWNGSTGALVYDSGADLERMIAAELPTEFNSNNDENDSFDARSDDKGPEPEGVTVGQIADTNYAFVGLERIGGVAMYDLSDPTAPVLVDYLNNRDFTGDAEQGTAGDLGPEGLTFIAPADSPTLKPLLAVMNEVSGTTTLFEVGLDCETPQIADVAPIGHTGIVITGSYDCTYDVRLTDADGTVRVVPVLIGSDGTATLNETITPDLLIEVGPSGTGVFVGSVQAVPTLGAWGLMALVAAMMTAALVARRKRTA
ncbi:Choice-of-anchor I family protein [Sulfidibacter corallicola]|uniref:Choice-of-anchor I family protein n=1 Tax=Sulfidibacter corallicola TaxID=2818388 RepID=A0A8A4TWV3_SULCO|nr:choice-of-anchor I family protein [Sulfidibacter corallicola]QTD54429.1 choice-of-anchor I family protein [Sulfidibacter corallicola]